MTVAALSPNDRLDGLPIRVVLEGLGRLHQMVVVSDADGHIVWMSDALGAACGGGDSFIGQQIHDLLSDSSSLESLRSELERDGVVASRRLELERRRGGRLSVDVSVFPIEQRDPGEALFVAIVRPAGEREKSAQKLRSAVDFLGAILDNAPDAVLTIDRAGFVSYANSMVEGVLGRPISALVGKPLAMLLNSASGFGQLVSDLRGGAISDHDLEVTRPDGTRVWLSVSSRELHLAEGEVAGTVAFLRDVTERKQLEAELERKNSELESYVHTVSHDLRSPLVSVLGFARLLREDFGAVLDDSGRHFLDRVEQGGRTMEALIQDLLELSRIGRANERRSLVDPRAVLLQLRAELKPRLDEVGATLTFPDDPPLLLCDRTRLYQVFSNLVGNALAHTAAAGALRVVVTIASEPGQHHLCVRDNGKGIPIEDQERIFEIFQTLGVRSDGRRSSGVGLAIVKKIVETHRGRVWVESAPEQGAAFHVTLPSE